MPDLTLPASLQFVPESIDAASNRYTGFASNFFDYLKNTLPEAHRHLDFYRPTKYQQDDVWAICSWSRKPFVVQLDPDCKVIVLSDGDTQIEIGTWESDPSLADVDFIRNHFE